MPNHEYISIIGHIGRDAEVRATKTGTMVCSFSVAVSRRDRDGQDNTNWYRVSMWGERGEKLAQYLTAGKQVFVDGRPGLSVYTDKTGTAKGVLEIMANDVQLLGRKDDTPAPERPAPVKTRTIKLNEPDEESIPF